MDKSQHSALDQLRDGELCTVVVASVHREAEWRPDEQRFYYSDGIPSKRPFVLLPDIEEWWPASVKF